MLPKNVQFMGKDCFFFYNIGSNSVFKLRSQSGLVDYEGKIQFLAAARLKN